MYDSPVMGMYLRPGNLYKDFRILKLKSTVTEGMVQSGYADTGRIVRGILAQAETGIEEQKKHLFDQDSSALTHTIVSRGKAVVEKGDVLAFDNRFFYVLLTEEAGYLGITTIYYCEERKDVK